jgi:hypothetical protein
VAAKYQRPPLERLAACMDGSGEDFGGDSGSTGKLNNKARVRAFISILSFHCAGPQLHSFGTASGSNC